MTRGLNLPNLLTALRFLLVGVFVWFFFTPALHSWSIAPFLLAGITDIADGHIARKYNQITPWGKAMDPVADKLLILTVITCLYTRGYIPLPVILIVAVKESLMVLGGLFIYRKRNQVVYSNIFGKSAAAFMFAAVLLCFYHESTFPVDWIFLYISVALSLFSISQYAYLSFFRKD